MINFSTPHEQIVRELFDEEQKAFFWLRKKYHGEKGYESMRDRLLAKCQQMHQTQISDVVEYISSKGNRWMAFECCQYYKKAGHANTMPVAFCYYETYGSVGAYLIGRNMYDSSDKKDCVIHFTNHFFLRFCQRLGVEMRSRWMVQRFAEVISGYVFSTNGVDEQGRVKIDVRLPASIGRGVMLKDAPIIEIRTYLTDKELSSKQLRETKKLREVYELQTFEPLEVRMGRIARSEAFEDDIMREIENTAAMSGIGREKLIFITNIRVFITLAIIDLGYVDEKDVALFRQIGERTAEVDFLDFVEAHMNKEDNDKVAKLLYDNICKFGERSGIKGFVAKDVMDKVIEKWVESLK